MKKIILSLFIGLTLHFNLLSQDTSFVEVWAFYGENAPEWFTDGSEVEEGDNSFGGVERGIAYSEYSGHLYVSSRHAEDTDNDGILDQGEPHVYILDPLTGKAPMIGVSQLLTQGITSSDPDFGGGYPLNSVVTTPDGSIFASNMTLASGPDIVGDDNAVTVKAFRVYRWSWEQDVPKMIINYDEGGYRIGDKFSVHGNWDTEAAIYAAPGDADKVLRWTVSGGVVASEPEVIVLKGITNAGTSITVADVPSKEDWMYVSGKGFMPTLFTTEGENLTQVQISTADMPSSLLAGRIHEFGDRLFMAMFSGDQSAFVFDITKHGENVTDADVIGYTPAFGVKFDNAYGEGAVDMAVIEDSLHVFISAPSNGIACYKLRGMSASGPTSISRSFTDSYAVSVYPNPATTEATVKYTLPVDAKGAVAVKIFDMNGKFVSITADKAKPGKQEMRINTQNLESGTYIYQVVYGNKIGKGKLLVK